MSVVTPTSAYLFLNNGAMFSQRTVVAMWTAEGF
jgi:hypothetical protein